MAFGYINPYEQARERVQHPPAFPQACPLSLQGPSLQADFPIPPEPAGGPLADVQAQVAAGLNGTGDGDRLFIPLPGPHEPVIQFPHPQRLFEPYDGR